MITQWYLGLLLLVRCHWCISIPIIIPTNRLADLIRPLFVNDRPAVVLLDCRHPRFGNFDSAVSIDVIWMKSYVDGFFNLQVYQ